MSVFMQGISISEISGNKKTRKKSSAFKYDGKKAEIMCNNNGKKTFTTLNNDQLKRLMAIPASKKTLKQRLTSVKASGTKRRRARNRRKKNRARTKKKRGRRRRKR
jgi:hypothetical protein|tara:strand:+ start:441 stop:758 length:318 start_codon:yes stop_codon:yes gene_type:complete